MITDPIILNNTPLDLGPPNIPHVTIYVRMTNLLTEPRNIFNMNVSMKM